MLRCPSLIKVFLSLVLLLNLTGCAMMHKKTSLEQSCDNSSILYTNLKKPAYERHYALPNGQACPVKSEGGSNE